MSGDNQHFIPQHVLKAFKIRDFHGAKSVWVYRPGLSPEISKIVDVAADAHFYSKPVENEVSLDDKITKYENRLALLIKALRGSRAGPVQDANVPAEVLAHLTVRTESMRSGLAYGAKQVVGGIFGMLHDPEQFRRMVQIDSDEPSQVFKEVIAKAVSENPSLSQLNLPPAALERVMFGFAKENFANFLAESMSLARASLARMHEEADAIVANSQKKALEQGLVPGPRQKNSPN